MSPIPEKIVSNETLQFCRQTESITETGINLFRGALVSGEQIVSQKVNFGDSHINVEGGIIFSGCRYLNLCQIAPFTRNRIKMEECVGRDYEVGLSFQGRSREGFLSLKVLKDDGTGDELQIYSGQTRFSSGAVSSASSEGGRDVMFPFNALIAIGAIMVLPENYFSEVKQRGLLVADVKIEKDGYVCSSKETLLVLPRKTIEDSSGDFLSDYSDDLLCLVMTPDTVWQVTGWTEEAKRACYEILKEFWTTISSKISPMGVLFEK